MNRTKKSTLAGIALIIAFVVYNAVLFAICGFKGHGAAFWLSWVFMLAAFGCIATASVILAKRKMELKDWLFGYPLIRHTTIYVIVEFAISTVFIVLDCLLSSPIEWGWVFAAQIIPLGVYLLFAISCIIAKQTIDEMQIKTTDKTAFIRLLQIDAEMLSNACQDPKAKEVFKQFSEDVRFSDPMSSEALFELEKDIQLAVNRARDCQKSGDIESAIKLCKEASTLLTERNMKCKALK
ncbi:MAG: hypothetical protein Q4C01_06105 [Clostridia bacterium]|nr:hypothetical protein [Clostridia bacterium]